MPFRRPCGCSLFPLFSFKRSWNWQRWSKPRLSEVASYRQEDAARSWVNHSCKFGHSNPKFKKKCSSVSTHKVVRVTWKSKTWRCGCGRGAVTAQTVQPGTQMRGNACLEKHPCPHLERARCRMIPVGESSHGSDRCHPLKTNKLMRCPCGLGLERCAILNAVWQSGENYHQLVCNPVKKKKDKKCGEEFSRSCSQVGWYS